MASGEVSGGRSIRSGAGERAARGGFARSGGGATRGGGVGGVWRASGSGAGGGGGGGVFGRRGGAATRAGVAGEYVDRRVVQVQGLARAPQDTTARGAGAGACAGGDQGTGGLR